MQSNRILGAALALAGFTAAPAQATVDPDMLMQSYEKLLQRVEQLELANKKLESALGQATHRGTGEVAGRVEKIENQILDLKKSGKVEEALGRISAGASLTMVAKRALSGTTTGKDESQLNYRADVEIEIPGGVLGKLPGYGDSRFYAHFRAGQGNGFSSLNPTLSGTGNASTFQLSHGDESAVILAQAWYQLGIPLSEDRSGRISRVEATIGKIDLFGFFDGNEIADDESEGFLNHVFVHNPILDSGGDISADGYGFAPGAILSYLNDTNNTDHWRFALGLFGSGPGALFNDSFTKPLVIGQAQYAGKVLRGLRGAYRLYAWSNGRATPYANAFDTHAERHGGVGFSVDQQVTQHLTLFARYGHSTHGRVKFDRAYTLGGQLEGAGWGRANDRVGLALGWLSPSSEFKASAPVLDADADTTPDFGFTPSGAEKQVELFYSWQVNDNLRLSPSLQWISRPGGDDSVDDITILGLRAKAAF